MMSQVTIVTNNVPRPLVPLSEAPASVLSDFDYIKGEDAFTPRLFRYRGEWYDVSEFMHVDRRPRDELPFREWDGVQSDSYFSGVLIRWPEDEYGNVHEFDSVIVGRYYS